MPTIIPDPIFSVEVDYSILDDDVTVVWTVTGYAGHTAMWQHNYANTQDVGQDMDYAEDKEQALEFGTSDFGKWLIERIGSKLLTDATT